MEIITFIIFAIICVFAWRYDITENEYIEEDNYDWI